MGNFPWGTSATPHVYSARRIGRGGLVGAGPDVLNNLSISRLRDLTHENLLTTRAPPPEVMDASFETKWGWAWIDDRNPVNVGPYVAWLVRQWVKTPPASLVKAVVAHKVQKKLLAMATPMFQEGEAVSTRKVRLTATEKKDIKEDVLKDLRRRQPPKIEEEPIVIDNINKRIILFSKRDTVRASILKNLRHLLTPLWGDGLMFEPWDLQYYLAASRPNTQPPADPGMKMLTWLAIAASHGQILRSQASNIAFRLELNDQITFGYSDGTQKVDGDLAVQETVDGYGDDASAGRVSALRIFVHVYGGRDYDLQITDAGVLTSCKLLSAQTLNDEYNDPDARLQSYVLDRSDDYMMAAQLVQHMIAAFDVLQLSAWMEEAAQVHLPFDRSPAGDYELLDEELADLRKMDSAEKPPDPAEPALFVAPTRATTDAPPAAAPPASRARGKASGGK